VCKDSRDAWGFEEEEEEVEEEEEEEHLQGGN